jgi:protein-S-isoprenylcysteine O-methyltransferase Ste14
MKPALIWSFCLILLSSNLFLVRHLEFLDVPVWLVLLPVSLAAVFWAIVLLLTFIVFVIFVIKTEEYKLRDKERKNRDDCRSKAQGDGCCGLCDSGADSDGSRPV